MVTPGETGGGQNYPVVNRISIMEVLEYMNKSLMETIFITTEGRVATTPRGYEETKEVVEETAVETVDYVKEKMITNDFISVLLLVIVGLLGIKILID